MGQKLTDRSTKIRRLKEKEERKEKIKKAAFELFTKKGFKNTKMEEIAEKIMISKGLLYFYFDSKEKILEEILKDIYKGLPEKLEEILKTKEDPLLKLSKYIEVEWNFYKKNKEITGLLIELLNLKEKNYNLDFFKKTHKKEEEILLKILEECIKNKKIKDKGIHFLSNLLSSMFHYSFSKENKIKSPKDIYEIFLKGVAHENNS